MLCGRPQARGGFDGWGAWVTRQAGDPVSPDPLAHDTGASRTHAITVFSPFLNTTDNRS